MKVEWGGYMNREAFIYGYRLSVVSNGGWYIYVMYNYTLMGKTKAYDDPYCEEAVEEAIGIITHHLQKVLEIAKQQILECEEKLRGIENSRVGES